MQISSRVSTAQRVFVQDPQRSQRDEISCFFVSLPLPMLQKKTCKDRAIVSTKLYSYIFVLIFISRGTMSLGSCTDKCSIIYSSFIEAALFSGQSWVSGEKDGFCQISKTQSQRFSCLRKVPLAQSLATLDENVLLFTIISQGSLSLQTISCSKLSRALFFLVIFGVPLISCSLLMAWIPLVLGICSQMPQELMILQYQLVSYEYLLAKSRYSLSFSSKNFLNF